MPHLELPTLEQRHWDLIGLALVGFAAFFACVFYLGWAGGEVGEALADAILFMFGGVGYGAPVLLFAAGALIVIRPMIPAVHPFRTGTLCFAAALMLGLAAGSLGLGPGDTPRDGFLDASYLEHHGGLVGESLFWASAKLFSTAGSHILFTFLLLAGVLLLTGRLDSRDRDRHPRRRGHHNRARAPHHRDRARLRTSRCPRSPRRSPMTASRSSARRTWRCRWRTRTSSTSTSPSYEEQSPTRGQTP